VRQPFSISVFQRFSVLFCLILALILTLACAAAFQHFSFSAFQHFILPPPRELKQNSRNDFPFRLWWGGAAAPPKHSG